MATDKFTGERPGWGEDFDYDESRHVAAYGYARELAEGKSVLDAGCGEGFGTVTLTETASSVLGVDYSEDAIAACRKKWEAPNLSFRRLDLTHPDAFDEQFDLVLNFQVLEHIQDELPFLEGLKARIKPGGRLMLTTPNALKSFSENPYHVREYTSDQLRALLEQVFSEVEIHGMHGNEKVAAFDAGRERAVKKILRLDTLGLRNLLPESVTNFAFANLSVLVRRSARRESAITGAIRPEDFEVRSDALDEALDFVALCRP
jgi:2-polyprenyl-3-methyl-5-hydroxy-6-metoxy-1,4-benzoquinol methylase